MKTQSKQIIKIINLLVPTIIILYSCSGYTSRFIGEKIDFTLCGISPESEINSCDKKVLVYIDSIGCLSCKMELTKWKYFIKDMEKLTNNGRVILLFDRVNPSHVDLLKIIYEWNYPVIEDTYGILNQKYEFSKYRNKQCLLLNKSNEIELMGNPIKDSRIYGQYLDLIKPRKTYPKIDSSNTSAHNQ